MPNSDLVAIQIEAGGLDIHDSRSLADRRSSGPALDERSGNLIERQISAVDVRDTRLNGPVKTLLLGKTSRSPSSLH